LKPELAEVKIKHNSTSIKELDIMLSKTKKYFGFEELQTDWTTEIVSGVTLFLSLSYIFIVNPSILSQAGMPVGAVFFATVIASALSTLFMEP
jgi:adenine/guanine/hypoxanthine permease